MTTSVCQRCGTTTFRPGAGRAASLCTACRGGRQKYTAAHRTIRKTRLQDAFGQACFRCGRVMREGEELHLDHLDGGGPDDYVPGYFSHARCNAAAGGKINRMGLSARPEVTGPPAGQCEHGGGCVCWAYDHVDESEWRPAREW